MAAEPSYTPLGDLCDSERGITYGIVKVGDFVPGGVRVIRGGDIRNGRIAFDDEKRVTEGISQQFQRTILKGGEIIINLIAEPGHTAIVPQDLAGANVSRDVGVIPLNNSVDHRYVDYCLKSPQAIQWLTARLQGSVTQKINLGTLRDLPIPTPTVEEQSAIAGILGALDDKIELNRRMNETLEAMARAIFKSWFVDFDVVRAKAEDRGSSLPKPLSAIFPARLVDSDLGEIPEGWGVGTVAHFCTLNPETWSKETRPPIIKYVDLSNTKWGRIETVTAHTQKDAPSRAQRVLRTRDTIVGSVRPGNGSYAFVSEDGLTGSTGFAVLRPLRVEYAEFVYFAVTAAGNIDALAHLADGGAYPAVRPEVVAATQAVKPGDAVIERFSSITRPLLAKMAENERGTRTLAALRDTLLPKLLSGELRVGEGNRRGGQP